MSVDPKLLGETTAELMENLDGVDGELEEVLVIAAINEGDQTLIRYRCSNERGYVQHGLLTAALKLSEYQIEGDE